MRKMILALALTLILTPAAWAGELIVSAAASLTDTFNDLKPVYEKAHPGDTLTFNFAASGALLAQMAQGAPVDVFASADQKTMDDAAAKSLVDPATRMTFAKNDLVIATPAGAPAVKSMEALKAAPVKHMGLGNPDSVPAGRYAKAALTKAGLWDALSAKYVMAESVRQVLDYLARGEVDAGFVYATDAKKGGDKVAVTAIIPLDKPVTYPVAVTAATKNKKAAQAFVDFLKSPEAQKILAARGFAKP
ncbi:molybdate ABC transporter substrate-binding protein [Desulfovibrio sp.]